MHDETNLSLASIEAFKSKDPNKQVGCVIVRPNGSIASSGYNRLPKGYDFDYHTMIVKNEIIEHAEMMAISLCAENMIGYSLYVYPIPPCSRCAATIINSGITRVITHPVETGSKWEDSCKLAKCMFEKAGVEYIEL